MEYRFDQFDLTVPSSQRCTLAVDPPLVFFHSSPHLQTRLVEDSKWMHPEKGNAKREGGGGGWWGDGVVWREVNSAERIERQ